MMSESILSNEKVCFRCGTPLDLHKHHIFFGNANRKMSERFGCWIWLCARHHNMSDEGIHFDRAYDLEIKQMCQEEWENRMGDRAAFIRTFGKSYL